MIWYIIILPPNEVSDLVVVVVVVVIQDWKWSTVFQCNVFVFWYGNCLAVQQIFVKFGLKIPKFSSMSLFVSRENMEMCVHLGKILPKICYWSQLKQICSPGGAGDRVYFNFLTLVLCYV